MRIIAGAWRGRKLVAPTGATTRPTADRARETLFSMLTSRLGGFTGLTVADLFAGSGALGLEAMSRGAVSCLFVDTDREAVAAIRANVASLGADGADIRQSSALNPHTVAKPFDLIFLDPPYVQGDLGALLDQLIARGWIVPGTMMSVETAHGAMPDCPSLTHLVSRKVGKAELHLFRMD
jgi:16S rRNA (guanine966-N2)-methyltransferase